MAEPTTQTGEVADDIRLTVQHASKRHIYTFSSNATIADLSLRITESLSILEVNQKFLQTHKPGLLKPPFSDPSKPQLCLADITTRKITLLGSTPAQISSLNASIASSAPRQRTAGPIKPAIPARTVDWKKQQQSSTYTFLAIRPLPYLPRPERSTAFLERLRDDPGIRATMLKHKWSVPVLTEMNPAEHTTASHEGVGRTLGLNRNAGEVIELRLRTDAYDGYRDYKTIRNTLCHELAHNVHGPHDRDFWELCHQVEREVEAADWKSGGRSLTEQVYYEPVQGEGVVADHGGWEGGEYVLGGRSNDGESSGGNREHTGQGSVPLSRREVLARAADARMRKANEQGNKNP